MSTSGRAVNGPIHNDLTPRHDSATMECHAAPSRGIARSVLAFACLAAMFGIAGTALAQSGEIAVAVDPFAGPIVPTTGMDNATITITVDCALVARSSPEPVRVELAIEDAPPWVVFTLDPPVVFIPAGDCPLGTPAPATSTLIASTRPEAPAMRSAPFTVIASTEALGDTFEAQQDSSIMADFFGAFSLALVNETTDPASPGGRLDIPVRITNLGNGVTRFLSTVTVEGDNADAWKVTAPSDLTLESPAEDGTATTAVAVVIAWAPESHGARQASVNITLEVASHHGPDPSKPGAADRMTFMIMADGFENGAGDESNGVPAPAAGLAIIGLATVAQALRRRRA